jgi:hypothetical protein
VAVGGAVVAAVVDGGTVAGVVVDAAAAEVEVVVWG